MEWLLILAALVFMFKALEYLLGISLPEALMEIFHASKRKLYEETETAAYANEHKFKLMSNARRNKSKLYKYYSFINDILLDMGWAQVGVTVEGLTVIVLLATILVDLLGALVIKNALVAVLLFIVTYVTFIAALFAFSRHGHMVRKRFLIDAENILCSTISLGLERCISEAVPKIDKSVRAPFLRFLDDVQVQNMPMDIALYTLNRGLGSQFDSFCDKALSLYTVYSQGTEDSFSFNVRNNALEVKLDTLAEDTFSRMSTQSMRAISIVIAFVGFSIGLFPDVRRFYLSPQGIPVLVGYGMMGALLFIYIKWVQSRKPLKRKKDIKK